MAKNLLESLAATLLLAFLAVSTAGAQPPTNTTDQFSGSETFSGEGCRGETADITDEWTAEFIPPCSTMASAHRRQDGHRHFVDTERRDLTGHATSSFAQNSKNRAFNGIIMLNGQGNGSDGAKFSLRAVIHTTVRQRRGRGHV